MIKVPATIEGLEAITALTAEGISVNVTLIFSLERYGAVLDAFESGLEQAKANGHDLAPIARRRPARASADRLVDGIPRRTRTSDRRDDDEGDGEPNAEGEADGRKNGDGDPDSVGRVDPRNTRDDQRDDAEDCEADR